MLEYQKILYQFNLNLYHYVYIYLCEININILLRNKQHDLELNFKYTQHTYAYILVYTKKLRILVILSDYCIIIKVYGVSATSLKLILAVTGQELIES